MILSMIKRDFRDKRKLCVYHNDLVPGRKTLFFIHRLRGSAKNWQAQFRRFSQGYNIVAYDLMGHGQSASPKKTSDYTITESLADAYSIIRYFELENITIVACGYGVLIGLLLSERYANLVNKQLLINPVIYQQKKHLPWYLLSPLAWLFQWFLSGKTRLSGNNNLYFPKLFVLKAYYRALRNLPELDTSRSKIKTPTRILRSTHIQYKKVQSINDFYRTRYHAKIKSLTKVSSFPMVEAPRKVNYFLAQHIDELNINAFRNLVFEGAGIRAIAYSGAITALESMGVLKYIHRFAGVSAGAIYAICLAVGYTAKEIEEIARNINYSSFTDASGNFLTNSKRLLTDFGWYKGDVFIEYMQGIIDQKTGIPGLTFEQLKAETGNELFIIGTNLSTSCAEIYSPETTPKMKVINALRISACIPMFFKAVKHKQGDQEHVLVDGGLCWNCPIELFDYKKYLDNPLNTRVRRKNTDKQPASYAINFETLGFRLDPREDPLNQMRMPEPYHKIGNILEFTREFIKFYSTGVLKRHFEPDNWNRAIFVDTLDIVGTDFAISKENISRLIAQGKIGVYQHFAWRMSENGVKFPQ